VTYHQDLAEKTKVFILRRTAEVIAKFLPPKTETVVFCRPTEAQAAVYRAVLGSPVFGKVLGSPEASLQLITVLKKVCNSPSLLRKKSDQDSGHAKIVQLLSDIPANATLKNPASSSGKLQVLHHLLNGVRSTTEEKVVLVSNYTSTLDLLQTHLVANNWKFLRLDGSTPSSKRQQMVDTFNRTPPKVHFVFLLSAKSGGVGLNLIGASRLILFDVDWNPSTDLQAMARIHRDGQTREVRIYRLLTAGALDEKIYQRQLTKQGLADNVMDQKSSTGSFSRDELRDLFRLDTTSICQTHDLLRCKCQGDGFLARRADDTVIEIGDTEDEDDDFEAPPLGTLIMANKLDMAAQEKRIKEQALEKHEKKNSMQSLMQFLHIDSTKENGRDGVLAYEAAIDDDVLLNVLKKDDHGISYIFTKTSS
jgi:DNA repair and recombination protein RAD54B